MAEPSNRSPLPFERKSKKKKIEKKPPTVNGNQSRQSSDKKSRLRDDGGIPEVVSRRMVKRMALFSGIPTAMGMLSFVLFYLVVSREWWEVPTYAVFAVSLLFFGTGVVGLSYGIFSTSWEEDPGTLWGWPEFRLNLGRTLAAWRSAKQTTPESGDS